MVNLFRSLRTLRKTTRNTDLSLDHLRVTVRSGNGGKGDGTHGGVGGDGGDVKFRATRNEDMRHFLQLNPSKIFVAHNGRASSKSQLVGERGADVTVGVPVGVTISNAVDNVVLGDLNDVGNTVVVARGGEGGSAKNQFRGAKGIRKAINIDLKLIADVGFVGFPNAGKSTLLKALSKAKPEIANYPFTTLTPQIGHIIYPDYRKISLADLPGLIEGAHKNEGMGHKFLKHVERVTILLIVIDVFGFRLSYANSPYRNRNPFETIALLNKELELYDENLLRKPMVLCLNKIDMAQGKKKADELQKMISGGKEEDLKPAKIPEFTDVVQISADKGTGIAKLKNVIRRKLDEIDDRQRTSLNFQQLTDDFSQRNSGFM